MPKSSPPCLVIAEIGVNHNGDLEMAKRLIDAAKEAGADAAKFQVFDAGRLVTGDAPSADYQIRNTGKEQQQFQLLKDLQLSTEDFSKLSDYCQAAGIEFMASGFSVEDIDIIVSLDVRRLKIPSGEITNLPYLRAAASHKLPIILSTGMATIDEVEDALIVLEDSGLERSLVTVLHCTTDYPTALEDVNLRAMLTLRDDLEVEVGYSDHTEGITVSPVAVAMGASVIEKHLTLDKSLPGPDHRASLEPSDFAAMVRDIRVVESILGAGDKRPTPAEEANRLIARKSLVASGTIAVGEKFSVDNLTTKRPGSGISPREWDRVIGTVATRHYNLDELIEP